MPALSSRVLMIGYVECAKMKQTLKRTVNRLLRCFGRQIIHIDYLETWALARHLEKLFDQLGIRCVLDVGAHVGEYRRFLRERVGYRGLIVSFEPVRSSVETLNLLAKDDPQWLVCGVALGSEDGEQPINVTRADGLSSFLQPGRQAPIMFSEVLVRDRVETVEVRTLDTAIEMLERQWPSLDLLSTRGSMFLKMDTQGFNLEVLKGTRNSMPHVVALQAELSVQPLYEAMPGYKDELSLLEQQGFAISGMFPVSRDRRLQVIEFDCVMVRRDAAITA